ncbi:MAG TPA: hypothetical protein VHP37_25915 [Burkholderiales bacterium]|nr:hypothetical protein [Burkholderiales bacterium]
MAEVTVARIHLATPHRDRLTVRARKSRDGRMHYRMVHEGAAHKIRIRPEVSAKPLSFDRLVKLIDGAHYENACADPYDRECYGNVIWGTLRLQFEHGVAGADEYLYFATVQSEQYPQLEAYYRERVAQWCLEHCEEEEDCGKVVRMKLRRG